MAIHSTATPDLLNTPEIAAEKINTSVRTLERWRVTGDGPAYVRVGKRKIGYFDSALASFLAARTYQHRADELSRAA